MLENRINRTMSSIGHARRFLSCSPTLLRVIKTTVRTVPAPTTEIPSVEAFLNRIGRKCGELNETFESKWENLFEWDSKIMKEKGIPIQQRKYILRQVERLRKGEDVREIPEGKKSYFGGERKRKENTAKLRAEARNA